MNPTQLVNMHKESCTVPIDRTSKWGNPFHKQANTLEERNRVCDQYERNFWDTELYTELHTLIGESLGCHCKPARCHGDFLLREVQMLNRYYMFRPAIDWSLLQEGKVLKIYWTDRVVYERRGVQWDTEVPMVFQGNIERVGNGSVRINRSRYRPANPADLEITMTYRYLEIDRSTIIGIRHPD